MSARAWLRLGVDDLAHARTVRPASHTRTGTGRRRPPANLTRLTAFLCLWALWYLAYRLYYAVGGQAGMIGEPRSPAQFRQINLVGGVVILLAALLPALAAATWRHERTRRLLAVAGWFALAGPGVGTRRLLHSRHHR